MFPPQTEGIHYSAGQRAAADLQRFSIHMNTNTERWVRRERPGGDGRERPEDQRKNCSSAEKPSKQRNTELKTDFKLIQIILSC